MINFITKKITFFLTSIIFLTIPDSSILKEKSMTPEEIMVLIYGKERVKRFIDPKLFEKNYILAYYGHPNSKIMGIIGREPKERIAELLNQKAQVYQNLDKTRGVIPAIYIIYGTCQPKGNINIISKKLLDEYIKFAIENDFLIYLDHQIGKYSLEHAVNSLLPYLIYPNVHLAIDVEWRTTKPMREIGHITGDELNKIQAMIRDYMIINKIPGKRQFVFHQFNHKMLRETSVISTDYDPVILVHTTSGWGKPDLKLATHKRNSKVKNIPYKGFKLWLFYSNKKGIHFDKPLMQPEDVLALDPKPGLIIYQ